MVTVTALPAGKLPGNEITRAISYEFLIPTTTKILIRYFGYIVTENRKFIGKHDKMKNPNELPDM